MRETLVKKETIHKMSQPIPPSAHTREEILPYLRDILCELFDTPESALAVAEAAGLSRSYLISDGPVNAVWDRILKEANKRDGISNALLGEARRQYPENVSLMQATSTFMTSQDIARSDKLITNDIASLREELKSYSDKCAVCEIRLSRNEKVMWKTRHEIIANSPFKATSLLLAIVMINIPGLLFIGYTAHDHGLNYWLLITLCLFVWGFAFVFFAFSVGMVKEEDYEARQE